MLSISSIVGLRCFNIVVLVIVYYLSFLYVLKEKVVLVREGPGFFSL